MCEEVEQRSRTRAAKQLGVTTNQRKKRNYVFRVRRITFRKILAKSERIRVVLKHGALGRSQRTAVKLLNVVFFVYYKVKC